MVLHVEARNGFVGSQIYVSHAGWVVYVYTTHWIETPSLTGDIKGAAAHALASDTTICLR